MHKKIVWDLLDFLSDIGGLISVLIFIFELLGATGMNETFMENKITRSLYINRIQKKVNEEKFRRSKELRQLHKNFKFSDNYASCKLCCRNLFCCCSNKNKRIKASLQYKINMLK